MLQDEAKKELAKLAEVRRRREEAAGPKTAPVVEAVPDAEVREKEKKTKSKKEKAAGEKLQAAGGYLMLILLFRYSSWRRGREAGNSGFQRNQENEPHQVEGSPEGSWSEYPGEQG